MNNIEFDLKEYLDEKFGEVIKRQDYTNGGLTKAKEDIVEIQKWQSMNSDLPQAKEDIIKLKLWSSMLVGGFAVVTGIGIYTLFLFQENLRNEISKKVMADLEQKYQIEIQN